MREVVRLKVILQVLAFVVFSWQMKSALLKYSNAPTMVSGSSKTINNFDKHILITICKSSQFDYIRSPLLGYKTRTPFLAGEHNSNKILTWTGTGNLTLNETINILFQAGIKEQNVYTDFVETNTKFLIPFGVCTVLKGKPSQLISDKEKRLDLYLKNAGKYVVYITDVASDLHFQIQRPLATGDKMSIKIPVNTTMNKQAFYSVELTERQVNTGDGSCINYPDQAGHTSYHDCVEKENQRRILPILGCMVPWMSNENQCTGFLERLPKHEVYLQWIKDVYKNSVAGDFYHSLSCLLPCNLVTAHAANLEDRESDYKGDHIIAIYFKKNVKVETVILAYGMDSLLVEIGSSLGLWLGLSVVGLFDVLLLIILRTRQFMQVVWRLFLKDNKSSG